MAIQDKTSAKRLPALLACGVLATALAFAPGVSPFAAAGWDGAAHAKSDKAGGNGKGNGGNNGKSNASNGKSAAAKSKANKVASTDATGLAPNQKGKWNAMNANQAALDAHIANGNANGTIGALAQVQLAAKIAGGATPTDAELAFMEAAGYVAPDATTPQEIQDALNLDTDPAADPQFGVDENGVVSCTSGCDAMDEETLANTLAEKQAEADAIAQDLEAAALEDSYADFLDASRQRIIEESNKALSDEQQEMLFDEMGARWGLDLMPEPEETAMAEGTTEGEVPTEEEIIPVVE